MSTKDVTLPMQRRREERQDTQRHEYTRVADEDEERPPPYRFEFPVEPTPSLYKRAALILLLILAFYTSITLRTTGSSSWKPSNRPLWRDPAVRQTLLETPCTMRLRDNLRHYTSKHHLAGSPADREMAEWTRDQIKRYGIEAKLQEFYVYLNFPREEGRRISLLDGAGNAIWNASLTEDVIEEDDGTKGDDLVPPFHGHSKNGTAEGQLVYANYGSVDDFERLVKNNIQIKGKIALVRYLGTQGDRALKVKAAQDFGAIGCIIFSDPAEDGFVRGPVYPDGPWRPESAVQRGAVSLMNQFAGDVLTPGEPAYKDAKRLAPANSPALVQIPSIPISYRDVKPLLEALSGKGLKVSAVGPNWQGGLPLEYWTGGRDSPVVHLSNIQDEGVYPIWNVIAEIPGVEDAHHYVVAGNHRDSWAGSACDPNSGSSVLLEMARGFGKLLETGWRPRRTIILGSWDGEEANLIGSTEYVEDIVTDLRKGGVAYINVDGAAHSSQFMVSATSSLSPVIREIGELVLDPQTNKSLTDLANERGDKVGLLGAGSDFVAFQDFAGVPSVSMTFSTADGVFPVYHSSYDSFHYMEKFGNPGFVYHKAMAQMWGLLVAELADAHIVPVNLTQTARDLNSYVVNLEKVLEEEDIKVPVSELDDAVSTLYEAISQFEWTVNEYQDLLMSNFGQEDDLLKRHRRHINNRLVAFEKSFLDLKGLDGRPWFKHVIFSPAATNGYDAAVFPGVIDAIARKDTVAVERNIRRVAEHISAAGHHLVA